MTGRPAQDISGQRFGRLTALTRIARPPDRAVWRCQCDCGQIVHIGITSLRRGDSQSCGCLQREQVSARTITHGCGHPDHPTPEYRVWSGIKQRCFNPNHAAWKSYGGRGITMCDHWRDSFENFLADMGTRPSSLHSLDRIDNDGSYTPENCRWAVRRVQGNNRRTNHRLTYNGETRTVVEWARHLNVPKHQILNRLKAGWPIHRVLMQPVSQAHQHRKRS